MSPVFRLDLKVLRADSVDVVFKFLTCKIKCKNNIIVPAKKIDNL